jgi:DNA repair exonuclease SbcCD ATPase subunit
MLKIDQVLIDNFCQHEHLELNFPAGLTGIFGRNGAGKSNIANAVYSVFTGNFNRHPEGAAGCIRQGTDHACIEVHGELAEQKFRLRRDLFAARVKHTLWINGEKYSDKAKDIESWLLETSGLTPQMMSEFVFVGQQDLYAFLEANDTERSRKFAALCNTRIYERLRDEYGDMLKTDKARSAAASEVSIDLLKQNIAGIQNSLKELRKAAGEIQADIDANPATKTALNEQIAEQRSFCQMLLSYSDKLKVCGGIQNDIAEQQERIDAALHHIETAKTEKTDIQERLRNLLKGEEYDAFLAALKKQREAIIEYTNLTKQINQAKHEEESLPELEKPSETDQEQLNLKLQDAQRELAELNAQLQSQKTLIDAINQLDCNSGGEVEVCPLCNSKPEHWGVNLKDLNEAYRTNRQKWNSLQHVSNTCQYELNLLEKAFKNYDKVNAQRQVLLQQIGEMEKALALLPKTEKSLKDIDTETDRVTTLASNYRLAKTKVQNAEQTLSREQELSAQKQNNLEQEQNCLREQLEHLIEINASTNPTSKTQYDWTDPEVREARRVNADRIIKEAKEQIEKIDGLLQEQAENNGSIREAEKQLADAERKLEKQEALIADSGKIKQWFDCCDKAILWFKKDGLPRLIHRSILRQLSVLINAELELYDKPFSIEVNDDLTFTASFADGRHINSRALSGGQKVMFALSFLSAVNHTFLQNIGIMVWDEPTEGLDPINTEFLYAVMERKKKLLHQRGQQLVIITFDEGMIPVFDAVYRVEPPQSQFNQSTADA